MAHTKKDLQNSIKEMKSVYEDADTPQDIKASIKSSLDKAETLLAELEAADKPKEKAAPAAVEKVVTAGKKKVRDYTKKAAAEKPMTTQQKKTLKEIVDSNEKYKNYRGKSESELQRDASRSAKKPGSRTSKTGKKYREYRTNRSDVTAGVPHLALGGAVKLSDNFTGNLIEYRGNGVYVSLYYKNGKKVSKGDLTNEQRKNKRRIDLSAGSSAKDRLVKDGKVWESGNWCLYAYQNPNTGKTSFTIENKKTGFSDRPLQYSGSNQTVYDKPESIPVAIKTKIRKTLLEYQNEKLAKGGKVSKNKVVIEVSGGVAYVTSCPKDVDCYVVDNDNISQGDPYEYNGISYESTDELLKKIKSDYKKSRKKYVIVTVYGGVAYKYAASKGVQLEIVDYDNEEEFAKGGQMAKGGITDKHKYYVLAYNTKEDYDNKQPNISDKNKMSWERAKEIQESLANTDAYYKVDIHAHKDNRKIGSMAEGGKISNEENLHAGVREFLYELESISIDFDNEDEEQLAMARGELDEILEKENIDVAAVQEVCNDLSNAVFSDDADQDAIKRLKAEIKQMKKVLKGGKAIVHDRSSAHTRGEMAEGGYLEKLYNTIGLYDRADYKAARELLDAEFSNERIEEAWEQRDAEVIATILYKEREKGLKGTELYESNELNDALANISASYKNKKEKGGELPADPIWHNVGLNRPPKNFTPEAVAQFKQAIETLQKEDKETVYYKSAMSALTGLTYLINELLSIQNTNSGEATVVHAMLQEVGILNYKTGLLINTDFLNRELDKRILKYGGALSKNDLSVLEEIWKKGSNHEKLSFEDNNNLLEIIQKKYENGGQIDDDEIEDGDEDMYPDEPDYESDAFITDIVRGGYDVSADAKFIAHVDEFDEALAVIREWTKKHNYYPNLWSVNERGTPTLIDYEGDQLAKGGRLKSALMRDRVYKSNEPWEQAYTRSTRPRNPKYKMARGGLIGYMEKNAEKIIKYYLPGYEPEEIVSDIRFTTPGQYVIDTDIRGDGSKLVFIDVYFGDQYSAANEVLSSDYKGYASFLEDIGAKQGYNAEILTNEEHQTILFEFSNPRTSKYAKGGTIHSPLEMPRQQATQYLNNASREDMISILSKNDPNGIYDDTKSIQEFGKPATIEELKESFWRMWDGPASMAKGGAIPDIPKGTSVTIDATKLNVKLKKARNDKVRSYLKSIGKLSNNIGVFQEREGYAKGKVKFGDAIKTIPMDLLLPLSFEKGGTIADKTKLNEAIDHIRKTGMAQFRGKDAANLSYHFEQYWADKGVKLYQTSFEGSDFTYYDPYHEKNKGTKYSADYLNKNGFNFKKGGRLKSALMRDRKYKSKQPHEQAYKRKTSPKNKKYKKPGVHNYRK